ncbi:MAG: DHHA1 domain-containing protein [Leptospiraceae bacterium]|nr:DHHA1 domain-containing protein [Leptospiraceae bacterium]MDW7976855.1 DHHA1 domain-containing protein [Leptospiraceae bacterium]
MWVLFHKHCLDGTASASAVVKKFENVRVFPISHGYSQDEIEEILSTKNDTIYVVDFSLKRSDFEKLLLNGNRVIHIDHHITAKDEIEALEKAYSNFESIFNLQHSAAYLSWDYLFGDVPKLIKIIEDRDLWKKEYPETDIVCYYLFSKVLDKPQELLNLIEEPISSLYEKGLGIKEYIDSSIDQTLKKIEPIWLEFGGFLRKRFRIPAVNSNTYLSELGNELAKKYDGLGCVYYITGEEVKLSFRSVEGSKVNAQEVATFLGGGGHPHAAGARISLKKFIKMLK